ncbi:MAG: prepilin-type N-terminal cleavage/methylation domain-containing protein [Gammaproteobacteria bacterium]|nr:prepilin-type N-terminal cleavage/methylation domain-containing protein [Gammaproteobacteria bacterium]
MRRNQGGFAGTEPVAPAGGAAGGFTLIELLVAVAMAAILLVIAVPTYESYAQSAKVTAAITDIMKISTAIGQYETVNGLTPPPNLSAIGMNGMLDPWGRPYVYLSFTGLTGKGPMRKDKNLVPINTEYDLYSVGADGQTRAPLTAPVSQDDVILANDGNYIGLASKY